jgi:hypothetical protein
MLGTLVLYARFLEVRERRQRVAVELEREPAATPHGASHDGQLPTIECEALTCEPAESAVTTSVETRRAVRRIPPAPLARNDT